MPADCPFCAAPPDQLIIWGDSTIGGYYKFVQCECCFAQGPRARNKPGDDDEATEAAAWAKWNDQWALQHLPVSVGDAASGGGFDAYNP